MPGVFPGSRCAYPGYMTCIGGSPERRIAPPPGRGIHTNRKPRLTAPGENDEDIF